MYKKLGFMFIAITVAVFTIFLPTMPSEAAKSYPTGNLYYALKLNMTDEEFMALSENDLKKAEELGMVRVEGGFLVDKFPLKPKQVTVNGKNTPVKDGKFDINVPDGTKQIKVEIPKVGEVIVQLSDKESYDVVYVKDFKTYLNEMNPEEHTTDESEGDVTIMHGPHETYNEGDIVTCNRFNGYLGDQTYYSKYYHPFQSVENWEWSDCHWAIQLDGDYLGYPRCSDDYTSAAHDRYCTTYSVDPNSAAECSEDWGHSTRYHAHTTKSGPSGL